MPSKIQVDQIAGATGNTVTLPSGQTLDLSSGTVTLPSASLSALNASNLTSGTVPSARLSLTSSDLPTVPTTKGGTGLTTIGTAEQVLRVNSGATGLEFASASSDVVLLATQNSTSGATSVSLDGYFSATYKNYLVVGVIKDNSAIGGWLYARFLRGGSIVSTNNYYGSMSSAYNGAITSGSSAGDSFIRIVQLGNSSERSSSFTMTIYNPLGTTKWKQLTHYAWGHDGNANGIHGGAGGGNLQDSTAAISGINFSDSNGSSSLQTELKLYGLK